MQSHGITLSFHREMADSSRKLVGSDITAAVSLESYPRFIKSGFQDYQGLGIERSTADSKHVPSPRSRLLGNNVLEPPPESSRIFGIPVFKSRPRHGTSGTSLLAFRSVKRHRRVMTCELRGPAAQRRASTVK